MHVDEQHLVCVSGAPLGVVDEEQMCAKVLCDAPESEEFLLVFVPISFGVAGIGRDVLRLFTEQVFKDDVAVGRMSLQTVEVDGGSRVASKHLLRKVKTAVVGSAKGFTGHFELLFFRFFYSITDGAGEENPKWGKAKTK